MGDDRDILIEMRADMKHVRERVDKLSEQVGKQWDRLDTLNVKVEGHDKTIAFLTKGYWLVIAGIVGTISWFKGDR